MTNKQERYLVMSEAEFEEVLIAQRRVDTYDPDFHGPTDIEERYEELQKAEAVCRARPVPEWATHFCKLDYYKVGDQIQEAEEIKK